MIPFWIGLTIFGLAIYWFFGQSIEFFDNI